jgi:hypothetical protein
MKDQISFIFIKLVSTSSFTLHTSLVKMRSRIVNIITVCLVTLAVLSPGVVVFGIIWGRHIELLEIKNSTYAVNQIGKNTTDEALNQSLLTTQQEDTKPNPAQEMLTTIEQYKIATLLEWFFLFFPICIGLAILFYDRYLVYRSAVLQEQIEMLERLWQQSIEQ